MELPGFITRIRRWVEDENHWLTRQKIAIFGGTLIVIGISMGAFESGQEPDEGNVHSQLIDLALPEKPQPLAEESPGPMEQVEEAPRRFEDDWEKVAVRRGQALSADREAERRH